MKRLTLICGLFLCLGRMGDWGKAIGDLIADSPELSQLISRFGERQAVILPSEMERGFGSHRMIDNRL